MNSPIKKFNAGGIQVAVWENQNKEGGTFSSVSIDRRYMDKNNEWKSTNSLKQNDIPKAILALEKAYEYITLNNESKTIEALA